MNCLIRRLVETKSENGGSHAAEVGVAPMQLENITVVATMRLRTITVMFLLMLLSACEVRIGDGTVTNATATQYRCPNVEKLQRGEAGPKLEDFLNKKDYNCAEQLLHAAKTMEPDTHLISILVALISTNASKSQSVVPAFPGNLKLAALSYLNFHIASTKATGFRLADHGDFIRATSQNGSGDIRSEAFLLLTNIMQEGDIPSIVDGIKTGDESMVALGMFALAGNCSNAAIAALKESYKNRAVLAYLQKYEGKEGISKAVRERCPIGLT